MALLGHEARQGLSPPFALFGGLSTLSECLPCTGFRTFSSLQPPGHSGVARHAQAVPLC
jgi:hypothetical protein